MRIRALSKEQHICAFPNIIIDKSRIDINPSEILSCLGNGEGIRFAA
jgi:hypothetical protein